ncbi:MAG: Smr/MutS family protein [Hyphomonadaceae bacterium]|nr:Smr/MutS family protein [Hyphomonadaceae bacterium]
MSGRKLSPSESRAWALVTRSVRPLPDAARPEENQESIERELSTLRRHKASPASSKAIHARKQPKAPKRNAGRESQETRERRVRRGKVEIDARFDLHGLTQAAAEHRLQVFLANQARSGARCVLVITGKGRDGTGVLRRNFLHWLSTPGAAQLVSNWAPAHPRHGGGGAFYLFLRRL